MLPQFVYLFKKHQFVKKYKKARLDEKKVPSSTSLWLDNNSRVFRKILNTALVWRETILSMRPKLSSAYHWRIIKENRGSFELREITASYLANTQLSIKHLTYILTNRIRAVYFLNAWEKFHFERSSWTD